MVRESRRTPLPGLDITVSDYLQQNATEEELNSGADIADVLIRWQKENDLPPVSDVLSVSHTIQPIQQIQENPIMQEIRKYISRSTGPRSQHSSKVLTSNLFP